MRGTALVVTMWWGGMDQVVLKAQDQGSENGPMEKGVNLFWGVLQDVERYRNGLNLLGGRLQLGKRNIYLSSRDYGRKVKRQD